MKERVRVACPTVKRELMWWCENAGLVGYRDDNEEMQFQWA